MNMHPQHDHSPRAPRLTADELWYLGFLQWAEEMRAQGITPAHSRPLSLVMRLEDSLAAQGLVALDGGEGFLRKVHLTEAGRAVDPASPPNDDPPGIYPDEVPEMEVCPDCAHVVGRFHLEEGGFRVQHGPCPAHRAPDGEAPEWPSYDFRLHVDLCRCCGRVPLRSGSRWAVWFCGACKEQVGLLNGRYGRCIVPIGRHSVHSGHLLSGEQARSPVEREAFVSTMQALGSVHEVLGVWVREAVRRNLRDVGLATGRSVPLDTYWTAVRLQVDPDDRFREMCAYLARAGEAGR